MHPESAAQILRSGAHRGPAARLRLFLHRFLLLGRGIGGPHQTMGHDRLGGRSPTERRQEKSGGSNAPETSRGLLAVASELCLSSARFFHLSDAGFLHAAGGAFGVGQRGGEEGQEQQRPVVSFGHGDREPAEPAVH